jgi:exonuclease VII small subunit
MVGYAISSFPTLSINRFVVCNATSFSCKAQATKSATAFPKPGRRELLFILTATTALTAKESVSMAQDIPLFGIRKSLKKAEEKAEEIVREGFESAEKGLETAEKGLETAEQGLEAAEQGLEAAEKGIETAIGFGSLAQAGVVAGAEVFGVLVATAVVNGILGPEAQKS